MYSLLVFLFVGFIAATIAKALVPGRDPGVGISLLLGAVAQVVVWFAGQGTGLERYGQPWSFFLAIGAAAVLLYLYRETGLDDALARREPSVATGPPATTLEPAARQSEPLSVRIALTLAWAALGALMLGITGFVLGFFGPMQFQPGANQGPMLGIFITGPGGALLGALIGGALEIARPGWPMRWRFWMLNAANVAWGLFVLDLVADSRWR
jgi:uncharacterized membrane protein YeaQ/YmgE (transglycosylase-associated protein family)